MLKKLPHLGIDFGGVIVPLVDRSRSADTQFSDRFLATPPQDNAVASIRELVSAFAGRVWIVSKAGARTESLTRQWLDAQEFFVQTGLDEDHLRFCRERQGKLPICTELGMTHFVDDRVHVMQILRGTVDNLYLFGDRSQNHGAKRWTTLVEDWGETLDEIVGSLSDTNGGAAGQ